MTIPFLAQGSVSAQAAWLEKTTAVVNQIDAWIWGWPLIIVLLAMLESFFLHSLNKSFVSFISREIEDEILRLATL